MAIIQTSEMGVSVVSLYIRSEVLYVDRYLRTFY